MSSSIPLKVALGDLSPFEITNPTASRSAIIRALVVATVAKGTPLSVAAFDPPRASTWTTVAIDMGTELLITKAFQINNVKNLSALIFNAVRDPAIPSYTNEFLALSAAGKKKRVDDVLLAATGARLPEGSQTQEEEAEQVQKSNLLRFVIEELERTGKAFEEASARHAAAKAAFDALQRLLGEPSAVASEEP
jgi:hypothetical protein